MRSCIWLFYIAAFTASLAAQSGGDPDALYRQRTDLAQARQALNIWESRLAARPDDFESAWKIARASYWLGGRDEKDRRRALLERGIQAGRTASTLQPMRPEGYFWMAANMGELAESFGLRQGLKYRGPIKEALEAVLRLDPAYQRGSADRALGRWYFKVPGLFGGSRSKSEQHLRASLAYDATDAASNYFLAETLFALDRDAEARAALQAVVDSPPTPEFEPEALEFKQKARERLSRR